MSADLQKFLKEAEDLTEKVCDNAPAAGLANDDYRANLAGLLCVFYTATYENCIKECLVRYSYNKHEVFGNFASEHYSKLNSRIKLDDLKGYVGKFSPDLATIFKRRIDDIEIHGVKSSGDSIKSAYANLLTWRHAFAHEGKKACTLDEAANAHKLAKLLILEFEKTLL